MRFGLSFELSIVRQPQPSRSSPRQRDLARLKRQLQLIRWSRMRLPKRWPDARRAGDGASRSGAPGTSPRPGASVVKAREFIGVFWQRSRASSTCRFIPEADRLTGNPMMLDRDLSQRHPAVSGRQVRRGVRQSIPSKSIASCAGVTDTLPSAGDGQTKATLSPGAWRTGRRPGRPTRSP